MRPLFLLMVVACAALEPGAVAQVPTVERILTANFSPGHEASLTAYGKDLKDVLYVWTPVGQLAYVAGEKPSETVAEFEGQLPDTTVPGVYETRVITKHGVSAKQFLVVDDLPSFAPPDSCEVNPPTTVCPNACCLNGHMTALKPKFFGVAMKKGQPLTIEVFARRLNSLLDPVLRFTNEKGREFAFADDTPGLSGDALLAIIAPEDGTYTLELRDVQYSGGGSHYYHLRIGAFAPVQGTLPRRTVAGSDVQLVSDASDPILTKSVAHAAFSVPVAASTESGSSLGTIVTTNSAPQLEVEPNDTRESAVVVPPEAAGIAGYFEKQGDVDWFKITAADSQHLCVTTHTRDVGSPADVVLQIWDAEGKMLQESDDVDVQDAQLSLKLPAAGEYLLAVRELTGKSGPAWTYDIDLQRGGRIEVSTATDTIAVPKGGTAVVPVTVKRLGVSEPFVLQATNLPTGVVATPVVVSPKQKIAHVTLNSTAAAEDVFQHRLQFNALTGADGIPTPVLYRPAPPKADPNYELLRIETGVFVYASGAAAYSLTAAPEALSVAKGSEVKTMVSSARTGDWSQPIDVASAVPAAELPDGITISTAQITENSAEIVVKADEKAAPGHYTISLQGTLTKDKTIIVQPVPTITLEVTEPITKITVE